MLGREKAEEYGGIIVNRSNRVVQAKILDCFQNNLKVYMSLFAGELRTLPSKFLQGDYFFSFSIF